MTPDDVEAIVTAYRDCSEAYDGQVPCRLVDLAEVKENGWDLNLGRYLKGVAAEVLDVPTALAQLSEAQAALRVAEEELAKRLEAAGYA